MKKTGYKQNSTAIFSGKNWEFTQYYATSTIEISHSAAGVFFAVLPAGLQG